MTSKASDCPDYHGTRVSPSGLLLFVPWQRPRGYSLVGKPAERNALPTISFIFSWQGKRPRLLRQESPWVPEAVITAPQSTHRCEDTIGAPIRRPAAILISSSVSRVPQTTDVLKLQDIRHLQHPPPTQNADAKRPGHSLWREGF